MLFSFHSVGYSQFSVIRFRVMRLQSDEKLKSIEVINKMVPQEDQAVIVVARSNIATHAQPYGKRIKMQLVKTRHVGPVIILGIRIRQVTFVIGKLKTRIVVYTDLASKGRLTRYPLLVNAENVENSILLSADWFDLF